jgi:hypothetical protein
MVSVEHFSFLKAEDLEFNLESLINLKYRHIYIVFSTMEFHNVLCGMPFFGWIFILEITSLGSINSFCCSFTFYLI